MQRIKLMCTVYCGKTDCTYFFYCKLGPEDTRGETQMTGTVIWWICQPFPVCSLNLQEQVNFPCAIAVQESNKQNETFFYPYPMVFLRVVPVQLQMVLRSPNEVHGIPLLYRAQPIPSSVRLLRHPHLHVQGVNNTKRYIPKRSCLKCSESLFKSTVR